ncbi:MAG: FtsX-like permease family protein [Bacteroides sp.]|nr:FtsX-like permease family protein [Bacteroides sp.]
MLKLILKNIISRRGRYCWIFIELILVAVIGWSVLDEVVVNIYKTTMSPGYDIDRLASFRIAEFPDESDSGDKKDDIDKAAEEYFRHLNRILDRVRSDNRVEAVTITDENSPLGGYTAINGITNGEENSGGFYYTVNFWPNTDFFKTFGITDAYSPDGKIFEEPSMSGRDLIVSESVARYIFGDESAKGRFLEEKDPKRNPEKLSGIVGVVDNIVYNPRYSLTPIAYKKRKVRDFIRNGGPFNGVIRLKPGVDVDKFIEEFSPVVDKELRSGNLYSHSLMSFTDKETIATRDMRNENFIGMSIAMFFFINILLCMVGTFYLQTRKRSEETGVMRTFGASRGFIIREMLGEGVVIVILAWLIGCTAFWYYIKDEGLTPVAASFSENSLLAIKTMLPTWADDFWLHYSIVSGIILAIMLACTLIGIYIPARRISRINPIDALRDE